MTRLHERITNQRQDLLRKLSTEIIIPIQSAQAMLAQANAVPQGVLQLLQ